MALSRQTKEEVVAETTKLFNSSKMTVMAVYSGISVANLQKLRRNAADSGTVVRVIKNRLAKVAMQQSDAYKNADTSVLKGMLIYAFNDSDEVAPAQALHHFAQDVAPLEFAGAYDHEGNFMEAEKVRRYAELPTREELRGQLVGTLNAPIRGLLQTLNGNLSGLARLLQARKEQLESK